MWCLEFKPLILEDDLTFILLCVYLMNGIKAVLQYMCGYIAKIMNLTCLYFSMTLRRSPAVDWVIISTPM